MKIKYFAWLAEKVGITEEEVSLPAEVNTVSKLINWISLRGPKYEEAFEFIEVIKVVVNQTYAYDNSPVTDEDEVIFIPPIAGGLMLCRHPRESGDPFYLMCRQWRRQINWIPALRPE